MTTTSISQSTDFLIKELSLVFTNGQKVDLSSIFDELNLFDNIFTPCVSGNILITDAQNISEKLKFDGSGQHTKLKVIIDKGPEKVNTLRYEKEFVIYSLTNRKNNNLTSQSYILNFVSEDFIFSEQQKISQNFKGLYSEVVKKILINYLKVSDKKSKENNGKGGIGLISPTQMNQDFIITNLTPFDAINWITKRSLSANYKNPDYLFYETQQLGYVFAPLRHLINIEPVFKINFNPKNIGEDLDQEFFGARNFKVLSQFSMLETIRDGSQAGRFLGFDTLSRISKLTQIETVYGNKQLQRGEKPNLIDGTSKSGRKYNRMYDSRLVTYPFSIPRKTISYIKENNPVLSTVIDNTEEYVFQRKAVFSNLMQRRLQLTMPGNFGLFCGTTVNLKLPNYSIKSDDKDYDKTLSGNYIITATRHIIRYDRHETLIEIATDKIEN